MTVPLRLLDKSSTEEVFASLAHTPLLYPFPESNTKIKFCVCYEKRETKKLPQRQSMSSCFRDEQRTSFASSDPLTNVPLRRKSSKMSAWFLGPAAPQNPNTSIHVSNHSQISRSWVLYSIPYLISIHCIYTSKKTTTPALTQLSKKEDILDIY